MFAAALCLSTGGLFIKVADIDALGLSMWRSAIAAICLAAFLLGYRRQHLEWSRTTIMAATGYAAMLLLLVAATRLTTAASAIFLQFTGPIWVAVVTVFVFRERATRLDLVTLAVAFGGMTLFFVGKLDGGAFRGNLLALGAGVAFATFLLALRQGAATAGTRATAVLTGNAGLALVLAPLNAVIEPSVFTPSLADWGAILFLGAVQIALAYVFFTYALGAVPALEAAIINMIEPVLNPVWVFIFLGESPGWWAAAGGAIVLGAVLWRTFAAEFGRPPLHASQPR